MAACPFVWTQVGVTVGGECGGGRQLCGIEMTSAVVVQAFRFALDPSPGQVRDLERHAGAARFAYNWAVAAVKANISQRAAEKSYGVPEQDLTPVLGWNLPALRRAWNQAKPVVAPWWTECSKETFNTGLDGVARALKNWADSRSGKRAGRRVGFPRFKTRRRAVASVRFTTGVIRVEPSRHHVTLPRIGRIKTHESTRKLARRLEAGTARIMSATVRREAGRWYCAFTVEVARTVRPALRPNTTVGVDLGVNHLAVLSEPVPGVSDEDGFIANPKHLKAALRKLRRTCRAVSRKRGPDRRTGQQASGRWRKANRARNKVHHRLTGLRRDGLHKLTTALTRHAGVIVAEDLNVAGMLRNRRLARSIADAGFGEIRRQLDYKTRWNGGVLIVADRWFASSKTCSACGVVKPKLPLRVRIFKCDTCGLSLDRDLNAALNLKQYVAQSGWETRNGHGADQKTPPGRAGGYETSIPHQTPGQDGNRQPATAGCNVDTH